MTRKSMEIYLNGNQTSVSEQLKLETFLQEQSLSDKNGIAVAVNNQVISKSYWNQYELKNSDKVLVIKASQGG